MAKNTKSRVVYGKASPGDVVRSTSGESLIVVNAGENLPAGPVAAAVLALDKAWKWPLDRECLVRIVVAAYKDAENAKR